MYATTITEKVEAAIRKLVELGRGALNSSRQAELKSRQHETRDTVATYENLYGDEDARNPHNTTVQLTQQANHVLGQVREAKVDLVHTQDGADWDHCFFGTDLHELAQALKDDHDVHYDLRGFVHYIYRPDYEEEPDYHEELEYRLEQVIKLLESLLTQDGRAHRDALLEASKKCGIEYPHGKTNARLARMIEQREFAKMTNE